MARGVRSPLSEWRASAGREVVPRRATPGIAAATRRDCGTRASARPGTARRRPSSRSQPECRAAKSCGFGRSRHGGQRFRALNRKKSPATLPDFHRQMTSLRLCRPSLSSGAALDVGAPAGLASGVVDGQKRPGVGVVVHFHHLGGGRPRLGAGWRGFDARPQAFSRP
jgi:hypothetical protein